VLSARMAPDAQSVIYAAAWEGGSSEVFLMTPGRPESRALGHAGAHLLAVSKEGELALGLRYHYPGGERFRGTLARAPLTGGAQERFFERLAWSELHNLYGPTEASVDVTSWECRRGDPRRMVPIGHPIARGLAFSSSEEVYPNCHLDII